MATRAGIVSTPTGRNRFYELYMQIVQNTQVEVYGGPTDSYEIVDPYGGIEPCQPSIIDFDDRYRGKCKRLRKESRGWWWKQNF